MAPLSRHLADETWPDWLMQTQTQSQWGILSIVSAVLAPIVVVSVLALLAILMCGCCGGGGEKEDNRHDRTHGGRRKSAIGRPEKPVTDQAKYNRIAPYKMKPRRQKDQDQDGERPGKRSKNGSGYERKSGSVTGEAIGRKSGSGIRQGRKSGSVTSGSDQGRKRGKSEKLKKDTVRVKVGFMDPKVYSGPPQEKKEAERKSMDAAVPSPSAKLKIIKSTGSVGGKIAQSGISPPKSIRPFSTVASARPPEKSMVHADLRTARAPDECTNKVKRTTKSPSLARHLANESGTVRRESSISSSLQRPR